MSLHLQSSRAASNELHPLVHVAVAALLIWFVIAAWLLFGGSGYIGLALTMISVLVFMVIVIPLALWRAGAKAAGSNARSVASNESRAAGETEPLGSWLRGEFSTSTDRERSSEAAVEILLPVAAVAFGITALGIVFNVAGAGVIQ